MSRKTIIPRKRIYFAVEGEGEQSFIKFLQHLSDQKNLNVHLDCDVLDGGGYEKMLNRAVTYRARNEKKKGRAKESILIVDTDRSDNHTDPLTIKQLEQNTAQNNFILYLQQPNLEGILLQLFPGNETTQVNSSTAGQLLSRQWPSYQKPADCRSPPDYASLIRANLLRKFY